MHWNLYIIEGLLLAVFMLSAASFGVAIFHERSPVVRRLPSPLARRVLMGLAMGTTAITLIYSEWGRTSGAHFNPAVTLAFASLGKVSPHDAAGYIIGQFTGGVLGIGLARALLGKALAHASVNFVATLPGKRGVRAAALTELAISFTQLFVVLIASNTAAAHRATGLIAGGLVATWIVLAAPISGMSMNPARSLASALLARQWRGLWIYLTVPVLAMQLAAGAYVGLDRRVFCAKMHHHGSTTCPFRCEFGELMGDCESCDAPGHSSAHPDAPHDHRQPTPRSIRTRDWCNPTPDMATVVAPR
jgi:aquaporin Z